MEELTTGQAIDAYYALGLKPEASAAELDHLYQRISESTYSDNKAFLRLQLLLELSARADVSKNRSTKYARRAARILRNTSFHNQSVMSQETIDIQKTQLSILEGGWNSQSRKRSAYYLRNLILNTSFEGLSTNRVSNLAGRNLEALSMFIFSHSGLDGMRTSISFERQNRGSAPVDGKNYHWDVTGQSDGTIIDPGEYRIQIKNQPLGSYHPDIVRLYGKTMFGVDAHNFRDVFELVKETHMSEIQGRPTAEVATIHDRLFSRLSEHGPSVVTT